MDDYIKRSEATEAAIDGDDDWDGGFNRNREDYIRSSINKVPAADVRPVVRGKWIQTTQPMGWEDEECAECSVCGEDFVLDEWSMDDFTNTMNFCPNCGADMRGKMDV